VTLYYEMHVTIEFPETEALFNKAKFIAIANGYHVGDLLLMKHEIERSRKDMFFTSRAGSQCAAEQSIKLLCEQLRAAGFTVLRYKIEDTVVDSRIEDRLLALA
jgi:hypothetical protein